MIHMRLHAARHVSDACRPKPFPDRRSTPRKRTGSQRPGLEDGNTPVWGVAAPAHHQGGRLRPDATGRTPALVLTAARAVPRAERVGQPIPCAVGRAPRCLCSRARAQAAVASTRTSHPEETMTEERTRITLERVY